MTQWKLVPVEPTREMIEAAFGAINYTMPEPSEDAGRVYSAMLSAAPSPVDEDEVERVVIAIFEAAYGSGERPNEFARRTYEAYARAAISAMRPAPKLTEEDRARVEEMKEAWASWKKTNDPLGSTPTFIVIEAIEDALSLIDKLTNQEPTDER